MASGEDILPAYNNKHLANRRTETEGSHKLHSKWLLVEQMLGAQARVTKEKIKKGKLAKNKNKTMKPFSKKSGGLAHRPRVLSYLTRG